MAAALRLGSKYALHELRDEALRRLRKCYAADWGNDHWTLHLSYESDYSNVAGAQSIADNSTQLFNGGPDCPVVFNRHNSIAVLHLARQFGLNDLVPAALYRCACDFDIDELFAATASPKDRYCVLTLAELQDCIQVQNDLAVARSRLYEALSHLQTSPACTQTPDSADTLEPCSIVMAIITSKLHSCQYFTDTIDILDDDMGIMLQEFDDGEENLCAPCFSYICSIAATKQKAAWAALCKKFCPSPENVRPTAFSSPQVDD